MNSARFGVPAVADQPTQIDPTEAPDEHVWVSGRGDRVQLGVVGFGQGQARTGGVLAQVRNR